MQHSASFAEIQSICTQDSVLMHALAGSAAPDRDSTAENVPQMYLRPLLHGSVLHAKAIVMCVRTNRPAKHAGNNTISIMARV